MTERPIIQMACHCSKEYRLPSNQPPTATIGKPPCAITRTVPASRVARALSNANFDIVKQHATGNLRSTARGCVQRAKAPARLRSWRAARTTATAREVKVCARTKVPETKARAEPTPCCAQLTRRGLVASNTMNAVRRPGGPTNIAPRRTASNSATALQRILTGRQKGAPPSTCHRRADCPTRSRKQSQACWSQLLGRGAPSTSFTGGIVAKMSTPNNTWAAASDAGMPRG
mmetsp:Transcript_63349/g.164450  ORF Transcript_63349/g.164450 Transcript_63349/m.164450 type:complete len:231 (+) Transcript_63349:258-950(+)